MQEAQFDLAPELVINEPIVPDPFGNTNDPFGLQWSWARAGNLRRVGTKVATNYCKLTEGVNVDNSMPA